MHWTAILTMLMLALASSFLVLFKGWESWQAYLAVGSIAIGIILALLALLLLLSNDDRKVVWRSFVETFKRDLNGLFEILGIKKRL